jgi:hypothetical protein
VFCTDIPPLRETGGDDLTTFQPDEPPEIIAGRILAVLDQHAPYRLRVRARQRYRWDTLIRNSLIPLLAGDG